MISQTTYGDPYYYGCTLWVYQIGGGKVCKSYGYISVTEYDLCQGNSLTLYARIPDGAVYSYQWYRGYWVKMGNYEIYITDLLEDSVSNTIFLSNVDGQLKWEHYWCRMIYMGDTTYTGHARINWNVEPEQTEPIIDKNVCDDKEVSFVYQATGYNNYQWSVSPDGSTWSNIQDATSKTYTFTTDISFNNYKYRCRAFNSCGDITSNAANLIVKKLPQLNLGEDKTICNGDSLTLDAGTGTDPGITTYLWNTTETTRTITVDQPGNYFVTVNGDNDCQNSDSVIIDVDPNIPPVNLGNDKRICFGDSVYLDAGTGYDNYNWSNSSTSQAIYIKETGNYSVEVRNNNNVCCESDEIFINVAKPYAEEKICMVTSDFISGKNLVVWEKTPDKGIVGYRIYRESTIGEYVPIGFVASTELSVFEDKFVNPRNQAFLYKITAVDTCDNESEWQNTPFHKPIFLQYDGNEGGINLIWTNYEIDGISDIGTYLSAFVIYRGTDSTGLKEYATVGSNNNYTDIDPDALLHRYYYRVAGIFKDTCNPESGKKVDSGPYSQSMSNIEDNRLKTGINNLPSAAAITIFPNPFNQSTTIRFNNPDEYPYKLYIMDLSGKICRIVENLRTNQYVLERGNLNAGFYFIELRGPGIIRIKIVIE
jgi:hypothetical protein